MAPDTLLNALTEGTILDGPHWTEPVKGLTAKTRGSRIEVQAVGTRTRHLWTKLLKPEEFASTITMTSAGALAALDGNSTHFRLAAEAHRIRLAFQYDTEAERWQCEDDLVERLTMAENMAELEAEIAELARLVQLARQTERNVTETKFEALRKVLSQHIAGREERLLLFTEHKDTLDFLIDKLTNLGFRCFTIHGGMPLAETYRCGTRVL